MPLRSIFSLAQVALLLAVLPSCAGRSSTGEGEGEGAAAGEGEGEGAGAGEGEGEGEGAGEGEGEGAAFAVLSTTPTDNATLVVVNRSIAVRFSQPLDTTTLTSTTFTLTDATGAAIASDVTAADTHATLRPLADLASNTPFVATITIGVRDVSGSALAAPVQWSFTTGSAAGLGPDPVLLGGAGAFAILAKSGIASVPTSAITGDIGVSPIDSTAITGFSLTVDASNEFARSDQVTGEVRAADYAAPTPDGLTTAVSDMESAYTDAAGRSLPDHTELGAGEIGGLTLAPGLYKWGTGVSIATDVTLSGGPNDTWIFQVAGGIDEAAGAHVNLAGGALASNIFWQSFGQVDIGTTAHFEGIVLCSTAIILQTGASVNGRLLAQTAVTLDANEVVAPLL